MLRQRPAAVCLLCLATALLLPTISHCACTPAERGALLSFLSNVSVPADRPLHSWGAASAADCCRWEGISCGRDGSVVTRLWLPERGLQGAITNSFLDGLPRLAELNLSHNRLYGTLPQGLLWSDHLVVLDVSYNRFSGPLPPPPPAPLTNRSLPIRSLNVSSNFFTGEFPRLGEQYLAPELRAVIAGNNSFSGPIPIPPAVCSASPRLSILDLSHSNFSGAVPRGLGNCSELVEFEAGFNSLSGQLPADVYGAVGLRRLSLPYNLLTGELPGELISKLTNLVVLDLGGNMLHGSLPGAIGELTNLEELRLNENQINGSLPLALTNCTSLRFLDLRGNKLTGNFSAVDFSRLSQLRVLDLGDNNLTGEFPASIYSCTSLTALRLSHNTLQGRIAPDIRRLRALSYLSLSLTKLQGVGDTLWVLAGCRNLTILLLAHNFQGEAMPGADPATVDGLGNLRLLGLGGCQLRGEIPSWIAGLRNLQALDLSINQLTGAVPGWLGSLPNLFYLDVSDNFLSGQVPSQLTLMKALQTDKAVAHVDQYIELPLFRNLGLPESPVLLLYRRLSYVPPLLSLRNNSFSGPIPAGIGQLKGLRVLDLSINSLSGEIPLQLSNLSILQTLNLSWNHLTGPIPPMLSRLNFLASFSVAFNDLSGPIPTGGQFTTFTNSSFEGNKDLCGALLQRACTNPFSDGRRTSSRWSRIHLVVILIIILGGALVSTVLLAICIASRQRHRRTFTLGRRGDGEYATDVEATSSSSNTASLHHALLADSKVVMLSTTGNPETEKLTISDIVKATNGFHEDNIVGCGGFGLVYRANLPDGSKLAIKRLVGEMGLMEREFAAEVEALSTAQHSNLVSLRGYCVHGSFRLLVYSFMEKGSLDYWLHEADEGPAALDWPTRLRIAQGASRGLSYIHQICEPHIIHRDIKSSNILLDQDFEAHLADFGLSRLILPNKTHVTTELMGTLGYIPPEYGHAWAATLKGDIYSFGVVLLELLTGRRPVDIFKSQQTGELVGWAQRMTCQGAQEQVFDHRLRGKGFEPEMSRVLAIACHCVNYDPAKRPTIEQVVSQLADVGGLR
ncbi:hypothetical protein Taro_003778 [Colocasia esculenta]|uniref:non-specific serine/threonine protein kinase n=1 Tax=Colocasia esculenta TaxID=4460 RepID=A0A843TPU8_COLES|nr:hypothetical protein [Colocasia esculenta]